MLQWELEPGVGIGPLKLGMTRVQVAMLNNEIGEPQPVKEMYGILWEDRPGFILTQYMHEILVSVNICPFERGIISVRLDEKDMFDLDARSVLRFLSAKNGDVPYVGSKDILFDSIKVAATGYYDRLSAEYYVKTPRELDPRHIAVYLPEYVDTLLPLTQQMALP